MSSGLDRGSPSASVAREGQALPPDSVAGRALCWDKTEERHQLSWRFEASDIVDLRGKGYGESAKHRLVCLHDNAMVDKATSFLEKLGYWGLPSGDSISLATIAGRQGRDPEA